MNAISRKAIRLRPRADNRHADSGVQQPTEYALTQEARNRATRLGMNCSA